MTTNSENNTNQIINKMKTTKDKKEAKIANNIDYEIRIII